MWQFNNVRFKYDNPVDSKFGEEETIPKLLTYNKSKFALMQALTEYVHVKWQLGTYTEIDQRTVKYDKPFKV